MSTTTTRLTLALIIALSIVAVSARAVDRPWEEMDYGPFLSASITMPGSNGVDPATVTLKGIVVQVGHRVLGRSPATVCFDTDLLRYSAGWTNGWLKLMGTPFDGTHMPPSVSRPAVEGQLIFTTRSGPGVADPRASDAAAAWSDPRDEPYGPLPRAWAHYEGLYVSGEQVVFAYRVGSARVLDMPSFQKHERTYAVSRTLSVEPSDKPITLLVCDADAAAGVTGLAGDDRARLGEVVVAMSRVGDAKAKLELTPDKRLVVTFPPSDAATPRVVRLTIARRADADGAALEALTAQPVTDPVTLTRGGPGRFPDTLTTKGKLSADTKEPYVVDTLTLPDDNPWGAWMRPTALDFFPDGRAAITTWSGDVWIVSGIDDSLGAIKWKRFATGLFQPLGLAIVDGVIYALARDQITRLVDLNNDGEADWYENFNNDCKVTPNYHEFACDLVVDKAGDFYYTKSAPMVAALQWDKLSSHSGCILKVSKDGSKLDIYATGVRAANGLSVSPVRSDGTQWITCADNEGRWVPASNIHLVKRGAFLGVIGMSHRTPEPTTFDQPICWLPRELDNSAGSQVWVTSDKWGPLNGRMLHLSYGWARLFQVITEDAGDTIQGGVIRFKLNFESGIMRAKFNPADGQLYVAGLKGWQTAAARDGCLQRVRYVGKPVHSIDKIKCTPNGIELTFFNELNRLSATDPDNWYVQRWNYHWADQYGSDKYSVDLPNRRDRDNVPIQSVELSADNKTVTLKLKSMKPAMQMSVLYSIKAADDTRIEQELYYTVHRVPAE